MKKVCYVLAYYSPDYIRSRVILEGLNRNPEIKLYKAINKHKGFLRYLDTSLKLISTRINHSPDLYIIGFRGHESYVLFRLITFPKPIIFDEFINMENALVNEKKILKKDSILTKVLRIYMKWIHSSATKILIDTQANAKSSSATYSTPLSKFEVLYVGTDENLFSKKDMKKKTPTDKLNVFFYGNIEPLHGIKYILEAASRLQNKPIHFKIIGGKGKKSVVDGINEYIRDNKLNNIDYLEWVDIRKLPENIAKSDICLGGPFGGTPQAKTVITGKTYQFLAMGKPTIIGLIDENVGFVDKKNCFLVPQKSSKSIVDALLWAEKNRDKLDSIGQLGFDLYKSRFSMRVVSEKVGNIVREL